MILDSEIPATLGSDRLGMTKVFYCQPLLMDGVVIVGDPAWDNVKAAPPEAEPETEYPCLPQKTRLYDKKLLNMIELNVNKFTYRIITETRIYDFPRRMKNIDDVVSKLIKLIQGEYLKEISRRCVCYDVFADINASFERICKQKHSDRLFILKDLISSNRWQISKPITRETEQQINALWASRIDMYRTVIEDSKPKPVKIDRKMCTQLSLF